MISARGIAIDEGKIRSYQECGQYQKPCHGGPKFPGIHGILPGNLALTFVQVAQ